MILVLGGVIYSLEQLFSKYGPQTCILSITWKLVRNADSRAPSPTH